MAKKSVGHRFEKGNQAAVGNAGPWGGKPVTQVIISKLNEVDSKTGKANIYKLVDELFDQALSRIVKDKKSGKEVKISGDLAAILAIIDRVEGRPTQGLGFEAKEGGKVTLIFEKEDQKLL